MRSLWQSRADLPANPRRLPRRRQVDVLDPRFELADAADELQERASITDRRNRLRPAALVPVRLHVCDRRDARDAEVVSARGIDPTLTSPACTKSWVAKLDADRDGVLQVRLRVGDSERFEVHG